MDGDLGEIGVEEEISTRREVCVCVCVSRRSGVRESGESEELKV